MPIPRPRSPCPCGLPATYEACCARYHQGAGAPTPEALMRSRYSAYVGRLDDYLLLTWHDSTRPARLDLARELYAAPQTRWLGLRLLGSGVLPLRPQDAAEEAAWVEFEARYKLGGHGQLLHERSRFLRIAGPATAPAAGDAPPTASRWVYVDGEFPT